MHQGHKVTFSPFSFQLTGPTKIQKEKSLADEGKQLSYMKEKKQAVPSEKDNTEGKVEQASLVRDNTLDPFDKGAPGRKVEQAFPVGDNTVVTSEKDNLDGKVEQASPAREDNTEVSSAQTKEKNNKKFPQLYYRSASAVDKLP